MIPASVLLLAATLASGNAEFDRAAARGAAEIAIGRVRRELVAKGPAEGVLERAMLAAPGRFRTAEEAEPVCRLLYETELEKAFEAEAKAIGARLRLDDSFKPEISAADRGRAMELFPDRYARERRAACAAQAKTIALAIRPKESDFETADEEKLRADTCEKIVAAQKEPVFEENVKYVSETIVEPMIEDAKKEMKRQRDYLMRTRCDSYAPSALAKELAANLGKNVAERRTKAADPAKAWGIFPGTLAAALPKAVARRTLDRVTRCVDDVAVAVDDESVVTKMAGNPKLHYRADDSEKFFRGEFAALVLDGAIARAEKDAPAAERAEFAACAKEHAGDAALAKAVEARVRRELLPQLRKVRARISAKEMADRWPTLTDGTWYPEAAFADDVLARSDYSRTVKDWRKLAAMSEFVNRGNGLLEETSALADGSVAAAFDLARNALAAQNALVGEAQPGVLAEARDRRNSFFRSTPDLKKVVAMLTEAVEAKWTEKREGVLWPEGTKPANAAEQHAALFPSVKKRIELVARQILEDMEKPEPEATPQPEPPPKPEEPPPEDKPPEEPLMLISISVERKDGRVNVKLSQGRTAVEDRSVGENLDEFSSAMKAVADRLGKDILKLK